MVIRQTTKWSKKWGYYFDCS